MATQQQENTTKTGGKVWFITGASRGFGRVWTEDVLARGDRVAATVRDVKALDDLRLKYDEQSLLILPLDVTQREKVFEAVKRTDEHFGRLDVVLSNAGYGLEGAIEEVKPADVHANFDTNVYGTLSVIQAALPIFRAQGGGHVLATSSVVGHLAFPTMGIYAATKHAVDAILEALSQEVAQWNIRVTSIEPGPFRTDFFSDHSYQRTPHAQKEYDAIVDGMLKSLEGKYGDIRSTSPALFRIVDLPKEAKVPLRLVLGNMGPAAIRQTYNARLETIAQWEQVSNEAQGQSS